MPRSGAGTYTLPALNPVVSGTAIASTWANNTLSDIAAALTDSLSRTGSGGMLAPFLNTDGNAGAPGISWSAAPTTGMFRDGTHMAFVWTGTEVMGVGSANVAMAAAVFREDKSGDITAAATTDLGGATGNYVVVTNSSGNTSISSLGGASIPAGTAFDIFFSVTGGTVTLVQSDPGLVLTTKDNIAVQNGDVMRVRKTHDSNAEWAAVSYSRAPAVAVGFPNRAINGAFIFDQNLEGGNYDSSGGVSKKAVDGWTISGTGGGTLRCVREADPDYAGEFNALFTAQVADASLAVGDAYVAWTAIEGCDAADLGFGAANAQFITISFEAKSSITGTFCIWVKNAAVARTYVGTFTINSANTVERKTLTLQGDSSGTWLKTPGNNVGMYVGICFGAGTTHQTTANAWQAGSYFCTSAQTNWMATGGNTFRLKRFQVERGRIANPFAIESYQQRLARVQRYAEKTYAQGTAVGTATDTGSFRQVAPSSAISMYIPWPFKVDKAFTPATSNFSPTTGLTGYFRDFTAGADVAAVVNVQGSTSATFITSAAATAGNLYGVQLYADARLS